MTRTTMLGIDVYQIKTRLRALHALYTLDPRAVEAFMNAYVLFDGDWSHANGKREAQIVDYYNVLNHLCALGNVEKMYIPPLLDPAAGVRANQILFERKMMADIGVRRGSRVLDIGCGRGRVAGHVAEHAGAHVTGLNIDPSQVENAREYARRGGLSSRLDFVLGSLNDPLPFPDASFDGGYQIQCFTYARDKEAVFAEIFRVMRTGATFSYLDWVRLPAYDAGNPRHADIMRRTQGLIGAVDTPSIEAVTGAMTKAGFEIILSRDASVDGHQSALISSEDRYFAYARKLVVAGVTTRVLPRHFLTLFDRFVKDGDAFIAADRMGLATTSYQIVCRKPAIGR